MNYCAFPNQLTFRAGREIEACGRKRATRPTFEEAKLTFRTPRRCRCNETVCGGALLGHAPTMRRYGYAVRTPPADLARGMDSVGSISAPNALSSRDLNRHADGNSDELNSTLRKPATCIRTSERTRRKPLKNKCLAMSYWGLGRVDIRPRTYHTMAACARYAPVGFVSLSNAGADDVSSE